MDIVSPAINDYLLAHSEPADQVLRDLHEETHRELGGSAAMQISHDEGELLTMLVRLVGARNAVEVGTFTGYSSICIARGLPADGRLLCCDVSEEWTTIARRYWEPAGVADRIELRIAPAVDTLRALPAERSLDFAFIDADKAGYPAYYEEIVTRTRPGGLIVLDNMLRERPRPRPPERRRPRDRRDERRAGRRRPGGRRTPSGPRRRQPRPRPLSPFSG